MSDKYIEILKDEIRLKEDLLTALARIARIEYMYKDNTRLAVKMAQKVLEENGYTYE